MFHLKKSIMSKKFTSFLVLAAALLLSAPSQAQVAKQAAKSQAKTFTTGKLDKQALQKAKDAQLKANEAQVEAISFQAAAASQQSAQSIEEAKALKAADKTVGKPFATWNWAAHATPQFVSKSGLVQNVPVKNYVGSLSKEQAKKNDAAQAEMRKQFNPATASANKAPRKAETVDEHGIITAPAEGETKYYNRAGTAFYYNGGSVYTEEQSGVVEIVETSDGIVYIKDPVTEFAQGSWVKGTKDGNTITISGAQPLYYVSTSEYAATLSLNWGTKNESGYTRGTGDITFTIDGNTITLQGSSADNIIGIFWDDDNSWQGYGDYNTVWTLNEGYVPPSTDLVELPAGATVQEWYAEGAGSKAVPSDAKVAFVDNDVYISGIFSDFPESWIKGTISGTTVTFESVQYLGKYSGTADIWAIGSDEEGNLKDSYTFTYDSEAQTLTLDAGQYLYANASTEKVYYLAYINALTLYAEKPAPTQIDVLPYSNDFSDTSLQKHFSIIDANNDGSTWSFYSGSVRYKWSTSNAGDDWLISPAIKLVAGKKYHFSINAKAETASWAEKVEVKAATEATAEALSAGSVVIPEENVNYATFKPLENEEFTVSTSGYYYFGVHAISDADMYYLTVDDFLIEAMPVTAPYTGDFTQEGTMDDYSSIDNNGDGKTWAWSASYGAYYSYNTASAADDYLILPIKLEASKNYNVTVTASTANTNYKEKFEVKVGKAGTVDALTTTAISEQEFASTVDTDFEGSFTSEEEGIYYVAIHATSDADMWRLNIKKLVIEAGAEGDAPAAVDGLTVTPLDDVLGATIAFNAPTKSIDGSDLAEGDITKIEILRDGNVINTIENPAPGSAQSYVDNAADLTIGNHKYQVVPYGASGVGEKSEEITVFLSAVLTVPYTFDLASDIISTFSVIDNNADGKTWKWSASYGTYYGYSSANAADDYLISAPFRLEAGKNYMITVGAKGSKSYPEKLEVLVGQEATVAGLTQTVIPATEVATGNFDDYEGEFTVSADGIYYIAVHAISDADKFNLQLNKLSIEKGAEPTAPAAAIDLTAEAGAEGALEVNLAFTAPANAVNGSALSGTEDIKIYRDDVLVNTLTGVTPGSAQTWQDTNVEDGKTYTYYIVAANESGDGQKSEKVSVLVGQDVPAVVTGFTKTADTAESITFAWDEVKGVNGGYIDAANATYNIYKLAIESSIFGNYLVEDGQIGSVEGATTGTIDYPVDEGDQNYQYFGISAKVGENESDPTGAYTYALVGAPYELPIEEGFKDKSLHYLWDTSINAALGVTEDASDGDGTALALQADSDYGEAGEVTFFTGKVNLNPAANPTIIFDAKKGTSNITDLTIFVLSPDGTSTDVETVTLTDAYQTFKVSIPASAKNGRYNQVGFKANFPATGESIIIDNIKITDLYQYNLSVDVTAPKTVQAGDKATVTATVKNIGEDIIESYNITVKAGEKELLNQEVSEPLAMFESKTFDIDYETTIFDEAGDVTITATVTPEVDLDETDNTAETIITIKQSSAAGPENVTAQVEEDGKTVDVAWSAPSTSTEEATEDFEDQSTFAPFSLGGITAENHNGAFGEWTLYDGNGITVYGFQNVSFENSGSPSAWAVFNPAEAGGSFATNYSAHSGEQFLWSFCPADENGTPATDHWLISPSLPGTAQTIKFYAKQISSINSSDQNFYGFETFEVLASSTDNKPESFTKVADYQISSADWAEFTADLPAGTTYFAIRHNSTDIFGLLLDDITYTRGGGEIDRYNIYVDGELVDSTDGTTINVEIDESGEHTVSVTAVYTNGTESAPVSADPVTTTAIDKVTVDGKPVDIYSIDGKLIRKQATSLEGLRGIYVINDKKVIIK